MKKIFYSLLWSTFAVYCLALVWLLFLCRTTSPMSISEYFRTVANFVPLRTITRYITIYSYGYISLSIINLVGNFLLFLPMGAMLPCILKKLDRFYKIVIIITAMVLIVEILQGIFRVGTPDIDDLILNLTGAMFGYAITKLPFVNKAIKKISE